MQAPTYAELQTFKKVSAWLATQAEDLASKPKPKVMVETGQKPGDNPFEVFDRFPNGGQPKTLMDGSRAFRRLAEQVSRRCQSRAQRIAVWIELGIMAEPHGHNGIWLTRIEF